MFVFLDDSGDCGFKLASGSTQHVVLAACVFKDRTDVQHAIKCVESARKHRAPNGNEYTVAREFKYAKSKDDHKSRFFEAIKPAAFSVRAIVVDKQDIYSPRLRSNPSGMKSELIWQLLTHTRGQVKDAKLVIDGHDTRAFGVSDRHYFMNGVNGTDPGTLRDVEFADSRANNLVQLADMVAGSLRKAACGDKAAQGHVETYRPRMWQPKGSYWRFR